MTALLSTASNQRGSPWLVFLLLIAALGSAVLLILAIGERTVAIAFGAGILGFGALTFIAARLRRPAEPADTLVEPDVALLRAALDASPVPAAVTQGDGVLIAANQAYGDQFGGYPAPLELGGEAVATLALSARRDGRACEELPLPAGTLRVSAERAGFGEDHLVWRFDRPPQGDLVSHTRAMLEGHGGNRFGEAGVMAVVADPDGAILAANRAFAVRAVGTGAAVGASLVDLITAGAEGGFQFVSEGKGATPLRIVQVPLSDDANQPSLFLLLDETGAGLSRFGRDDNASIEALLDILPLGLALVNLDGRFVYLNKAFRRAAGLGKEARPAYPGDLVVDEDKAALSDAVRRFARGPVAASDMPIRLRTSPEEPIALTVAGARGLGEAAVLLSLKDSSEEERLKKQVEQQTKMQAVGQLAGGVAHDFNNILTAILGHCDLMLMRHTPGDSDYDDIQHIRSNSNRAASLTRQLLAFSRQQTLQPQVLQLPDVVAEVSNLLKRLLGETVTLQVKHERNLGSVRADPGQLEQVIVNLAVNARDAIIAKGEGGGTLTIHTYAVSTEDVRKMGTDILPLGEYTALKVTDTGTGIPPHLIGKVFEPFFTTKEVGKGTGLGLSTVYGIVKQSGGYIFAESEPGEGTSFTIYLPVHRAEAPAPKAKKEATGELWGTGTILVVEDEAMVRSVAERALTRQGYTVLTAENGEAALEILEREPAIDLMISDVVMPTMDGPTTVREARKTHPDLPVLFMSGYAEEQLRKSIDLERVAFLAKPFSVQKLAEAAREAMEGKAGAAR